jgi:biotin transport system substrate-specific component
MNTAAILNREVISDKRITAAMGVAFFALATALGAYVRIPVPGSPVPITLQTFFVLLAGAVLGPRLGPLSQIGYLAIGAAGIPVFQGPASGFGVFAGATGGYLIGFIFASSAVGCITRRGTVTMPRIIAAFAAGSAIILAFGASWLAILYRVEPVSAVAAGVLPFIPGDIVKVLASGAIYRGISGRSNSIFSE